MLSESTSHNRDDIYLPQPRLGNLIEAIHCWPYKRWCIQVHIQHLILGLSGREGSRWFLLDRNTGRGESGWWMETSWSTNVPSLKHMCVCRYIYLYLKKKKRFLFCLSSNAGPLIPNSAPTRVFNYPNSAPLLPLN